MERDEILARLRERIVAFAASRISKEAAEDLAQEVLIVLHEKYAHVTDLSELLPLSLQVLRWKMLNLHRKSVRRGEYNQVAVEDLALANPGDNPGTAVERKEMLEQLIAAMTRLSPRCRQLFRWKLQGKSFAEIQSLLGQSSINTVHTRDFRCRKQLLDLMGGSWEGTDMLGGRAQEGSASRPLRGVRSEHQ
ncbi:sigma-70 family RNA polymerase sigma factor [Nitrospiraceae bacterium AH_259_D15_M11_P09]|nr:sigma-70 family RNA polymerase sigma factor [Nitrospiraceae bacterium AH_259_D15_M11_P09]